MTTIKRSITIEEKLDKMIEKHNKENGSTPTSVIRIALEKYFGVKTKK